VTLACKTLLTSSYEAKVTIYNCRNRKLISSGGWSRCVKIRGGAGLGGLGRLPRDGGGLTLG
jgi:hypothetical protein